MTMQIKEARLRAGLTQKELAARLGISYATLSGYESNDHDPKSDTLERIADICNTTVDYLIGRTDDPNPYDDELSPDARSLALKYERLDTHGKKAVRAVLDVEAVRCTEERETRSQGHLRPVQRIYPLYSDAAAAGSPIEAGSDLEYVAFEDAPDGTSYAVRLAGDSMTPDYPDGSIVFVHQQDTAMDGDIVIAYIPGQGALCKRARYRGDRLVALESLNATYAVRRGEELAGARIQGKVIGQDKM